jgi:hypothetical protein
VAECEAEEGIGYSRIDDENNAGARARGVRETELQGSLRDAEAKEGRTLENKGGAEEICGWVDCCEEIPMIGNSSLDPHACQDARNHPVASGTRAKQACHGKEAKEGGYDLQWPDCFMVRAENVKELFVCERHDH